MARQIDIHNAGGSPGGAGHFFLGLTMMIIGGYLLLSNIAVRSNFGFGTSLWRMGYGGFNMPITTGMIFIPMIFGIGIIFYNSRNWLGWLLFLGSLAAMIAGVITSLNIHMKSMNAFELISILVLSFGGLGLFLRSLRTYS